MKRKRNFEHGRQEFRNDKDCRRDRALTEALAALGAAVAAKKEELAATAKQQAEEIAKKETKLALLKDSSTKVIGQIDGIIGKLDNILENNGSGNDNN